MKTQLIVIYCILVLSTSIMCGCSSSTSEKKEDVTPPPVPTELTITQIGNGSVHLTWKAVYDSGLKGYNVYWLGGSEVDILNANLRFVSTNSTEITGLDYETLYYFAVTSIDQNDNESALSVQEGGKPLNTTSPAPPAEIDLVAENIDYPKITVYWAENEEPDVAYYNLYRSLTAAGLEDSISFVISLTHENYIDIDVEVGVNYFFRVTAVDKGGWESAPSSIVSDYVLSRVELISPVDFEYTSAAPTFKWEDVTGAKKYNLVVTTSRIGGEIWNVEVDDTTTQTVYQGKTKLISGTAYYWKIGTISRREINSVSDVEGFVVRVQ